MGYVLRPWVVGLLVVALSVPAEAVEHTLKVANLHDDAFSYFIRGRVTTAAGELVMPDLERALDDGTVGRGALLYDREVVPAGAVVARAFGAEPVHVVATPPVLDRSEWKVVRWDGKPGARAVWVIRPATTHWRWARRLALGGGQWGGLRYFLPYTVVTPPAPARVVAYPLPVLRTSEDGAPLWDKHLARSVDLSSGLAAVVGVDSLAGDWVYLLVEQPTESTTFEAVVGWERRGPNDRVFEPRRIFHRPW